MMNWKMKKVEMEVCAGPEEEVKGSTTSRFVIT